METYVISIHNISMCFQVKGAWGRALFDINSICIACYMGRLVFCNVLHSTTVVCRTNKSRTTNSRETDTVAEKNSRWPWKYNLDDHWAYCLGSETSKKGIPSMMIIQAQRKERREFPAWSLCLLSRLRWAKRELPAWRKGDL